MMRVSLTRPVLFAERRFDEGVTINVSPEIGLPLVRAGIARDVDAPTVDAGQRGRDERPPQKRKP